MKVELLFVAGCPNREPALEVVREAARAARVAVEVEQLEVRSASEAERLRFLGSPSIRIDGRDVEPGAAARTDYALACRFYRGAGVPAREWIEAALSTAEEAER
jgi:hypothetical protein